ncbi:MAG TPA: HD domain-containing protein [Pirellulales bacterium]|nr:HD domain-containing protein [Pirellulales bacterium]
MAGQWTSESCWQIILAMRDYQNEGLTHDPLHGYIPFTSGSIAGETTERQLIDHPWLQRLRQIHQLQTAWWVFPAAEHTRFQHVIGVMHVASRAVAALYASLAEACPDVPSRGYVESLMRLAGLLHDVGHGPFGHFFDAHYLARFGHTHETIGASIICDELGDLLRGVRRNPSGALRDDEILDPAQIAYLIKRPQAATPDADTAPRWLLFLRSLFCGLYTVDNMDFVLRDAYMSGYSTRAFDLDRLLHYSFFSDAGLTIHARGVPALVRFVAARAELFRSIYFHRTVRAIDLTLADLFAESGAYLFPGDPLAHLDDYQRFTEWSLLVDVARWSESEDPTRRALGDRWRDLLSRRLRWRMACERTVFFDPWAGEQGSIFSRPEFFERALRDALPSDLRELPLRVDLARHVNRPGTRGPAAGQNFLFDEARGKPRVLADSELFRQIPFSYRICRVYCETHQHDAVLARALDTLVGPGAADDTTNM